MQLALVQVLAVKDWFCSGAVSQATLVFILQAHARCGRQLSDQTPALSGMTSSAVTEKF